MTSTSAVARKVDLFDSTYRSFTTDVLAEVRRATYGEDLGQTSWTTAEEYERFAGWLALSPDDRVLEVASGSGGPALWLARRTGCRVVGIDVNAHAVRTAQQQARDQGLHARVSFREADACAALPFADASFDAVVCVDSANHFPDRLAVLREWRRVLRPGGRLLFTDPVVVTGIVDADELAARSSVGVFVFTPPGTNARLVEQAGFALVRLDDATANAALVSGRWRDARAAHRAALVALEGAERFDGLQRFLAAVHRLTAQRRLSRHVIVARAPLHQS